jgi:hypothetical protein
MNEADSIRLLASLVRDLRRHVFLVARSTVPIDRALLRALKS